MNTTYPSSLTETEWDYPQRLLLPRPTQSKLRRHSLRSVFDALLYLARTGCPWVSGRYLPAHFPPWQTVYYLGEVVDALKHAQARRALAFERRQSMASSFLRGCRNVVVKTARFLP